MKSLKAISGLIICIIMIHPGFSQTENQKNSKSIDFKKLGYYTPGKFYFKDGKVESWSIQYDNPEKLIQLKGMMYALNPENNFNYSVDKELLEAFEIDGHKWKRITFDGTEQFAIFHIEGAIHHFSIFKIPPVRVTGDYREEDYIQKLDQKPVYASVFTFKYGKMIPEYIAEDTALLAKVIDGEKGYKGVMNSTKVLNEYNAWYAARQQPSPGSQAPLNTVTPPKPLTPKDPGLPAALLGTWKRDQDTIIISSGMVKAILYNGSFYNVCDWQIDAYDKANGMINGKVVSLISGGYDMTSSMSENSGRLSFGELTDKTVMFRYLGMMIIGTADVHTEIPNPEDMKYMGHVYTRVK